MAAASLRRLQPVSLSLAFAAWAGMGMAHAAETAPSGETASGKLEVPLELWDRPRSGRAVLAVPAVRQARAAAALNASARLLIRHPARGEGSLQAEELRTWLIAHALAPARVVLRAGPAARQPLRLEILP